MDTSTEQEVLRRTTAAREAISTACLDELDGSGVGLFISHHLEELDLEYWREHLDGAMPTPKNVLELLVLDSHWSEDDDENGVDYFDFVLPGDVSNYLISVHFDISGDVANISMES